MLIFLYGADTYRSRQKLGDIFLSYQKAHPYSTGIQEIDAKTADVADLKNAATAVSLFQPKKLIAVRNAFSAGEFEKAPKELGEALDKAESDIVVFFEEGDVKKTSPLRKFLEKRARCQEFPLLKGAELVSWIAEKFDEYGVRASAAAVRALAKRAGNDLWRVSNEVKKIAAFQKSKGEAVPVEEGDVLLLVRPEIEKDIFATIDELARKNKKESLALLRRHMATGDSPSYLLAMLTYQFRTLLEIKDMAERGIPYPDLSEKIHMHPFVLQKGYGLAQRFAFAELKRIYRKLFRLDLALKTGTTEPDGALDLFIAGL